MLFALDKNNSKSSQIFKKSIITAMKHNSSNFLVFIAGIRGHVMPLHFYRCMARSIKNTSGSSPISYTDSYINRLQSLAIYEYSSLIYWKKHKNAREARIFTGIFSKEKKRYRILSDFLFISTVNTFPLAASLAFEYYNEFSPGKNFEIEIQQYMGKSGIDNDSCKQFFLEIVNSAEPSSKWHRRVLSLSSELYGESNAYKDVFTAYIVYIIYKLNNCNISSTLKYTYKKSPVELAMELYKNREAIDSYLSLIQLHGDQ